MGVLTDLVAEVRELVNESSLNSKFTPARVVGKLEKAFSTVMPEIYRQGGGATLATYAVDVVADRAVYRLPPHVGQILRLSKLDSDGRFMWEFVPRSIWNPCGYGVRVNRPNLQFDPAWKVGDTLTLSYVPSGEVSLAEGPLAVGSTASALLLGTPTLGALATKDNAYGGYNVTLTAADGEQETLFVASSDRSGSTHTLSVTPDATLTLDATTSYEVVPMVGDVVNSAIALRAAHMIANQEGRKERSAGLHQEYLLYIRQLRLQWANIENIVGSQFATDTFENERFGGMSGDFTS